MCCYSEVVAETSSVGISCDKGLVDTRDVLASGTSGHAYTGIRMRVCWLDVRESPMSKDASGDEAY